MALPNKVEHLRFLTPKLVNELCKQWGTPIYVYSEKILRQQASQALAIPVPYGLTVRYAMKANPNKHILSIFKSMDIGIDASSGYEIHRALAAGYAPKDISLTAQQLPDDIAHLAAQGVQCNASSLNQLQLYGQSLPGSTVGVRINPGIGSGHVARNCVGGPNSSFGIWHEYIPKVLEVAKTYNLTINRVHTHIGSGTDPAIWEQAIELSIQALDHFKHATVLNIGGGFKMARMNNEQNTDMTAVGLKLAHALQNYATKTGRQLHLEIEPGSYLTVPAGTLLTKVHDIVDTGKNGHTFLKIDAGMSEFLRPTLYGAQHPIIVVNNKPKLTKPYVVVGRCCESTDILTPAPHQPEIISPRILQQAAIGDIVAIEGTGAYCATLNASGYNSFPECAEVLLDINNNPTLIRRAQTLQELICTEDTIP